MDSNILFNLATHASCNNGSHGYQWNSHGRGNNTHGYNQTSVVNHNLF